MTVVKFRKRTWHARAIRPLVVLIVALLAALGWQHMPDDIGEIGKQITAAVTEDASADQSGGRVYVTSVHDGDTFRIGRERIRVLGMDAPEIGEGAKCANEQRMAERSRDYLRSALRSGNVRIERHGHDVYGRTLARIYVDGRDIAGAMLSAGLAKPYVPRHHGNWCDNAD